MVIFYTKTSCLFVWV